MRSMGEGHALATLTFWHGDTLNVPLHRLRRSRCCSATPTAPPYRGGFISPLERLSIILGHIRMS